MSAATDAAGRTPVGLPRPEALRALIGARLRERAFWAVQAGVLAVTAVHVGLEAVGLHEHGQGLPGMLAHLPVVLYLLPVSYAGLRYGFEGSLLTGAWAAMLAVPNLLVWHADGLAWLGELVLIGVVVGVGALVALPVEREQQQRREAEAASRQAEATSHRLALLNETGEILLRTALLDDALRSVLGRLLEVLDLRAAAVVTWRASDPPSIEVCRSRDADGDEALRRSLRSDGVVDAGTLVVPCPSQVRNAALCARPGESRALERQDHELLATVAVQLGVAMDNAHLHQLNRQHLRTYLQKVTQAQEEERRRIARDLHDVATHELLLLCRDLDAVVEPAGDGARRGHDALARQVQRLRVRTSGVVEYLRRCSRDLRPPVLDTLGLAPALQWLTSQLEDGGELEVGFEVHGSPRRLDPDVELALFRIAQEACRNAQRHAAAGEVMVRLAYLAEGVRVDVDDDGAGFVVPDRLDERVQEGRLGLAGMRERAELAGCRLAVRSRPGAGTRVTVESDAAARAARAC